MLTYDQLTTTLRALMDDLEANGNLGDHDDTAARVNTMAILLAPRMTVDERANLIAALGGAE